MLKITCPTGEIKEYPTAGVGINSFLLDDSSSDDITREIGEQFSNDGMRVYELSYIEGKLTVDANYEGSSSFKQRCNNIAIYAVCCNKENRKFKG